MADKTSKQVLNSDTISSERDNRTHAMNERQPPISSSNDDARETIDKTMVVFPAAFLMALALGLLNLGLVFYAKEVFQATPAEVGILFAMWSGVYVFGCLVIRPKTEHIPARRLIAAATFLTGVIPFAMLLVPASIGLAGLYALNAFSGLTLSFFWPPLMGWLSAGNEGKRLGSLMSRYNCSWCAGMILGPGLAGWLSDLRTSLPLMTAGVTLLISTAWIVVASARVPRSESERDPARPCGGATAAEGGTYLRFPAWVGIFCAFFGLGVLAAVFPLIAYDKLNISKSAIGGLFFIRCSANALGFFLLGKTTLWHFRLNQMLAGQLVTLAVFAALAFMTSIVGIGALFLIFGLTMSLSYTNSLFHGVSGSSRRTARMAIHESVLAAGLVTGSAGGGEIYQRFGSNAVYMTCAGILLVGIIVQATIWFWFQRDGVDENVKDANHLS